MSTQPAVKLFSSASPPGFQYGYADVHKPCAVVRVFVEAKRLRIHVEELECLSSMSFDRAIVVPHDVKTLSELCKELRELEESPRQRTTSVAYYQQRHKELGLRLSAFLFGSLSNAFFRSLKVLLHRTHTHQGFIRIVFNDIAGDLRMLPWEYALGPDNLPLGVHPRLAVVRMPDCQPPQHRARQAAKPLDIALISTARRNEPTMVKATEQIYGDLRRLASNPGITMRRFGPPPDEDPTFLKGNQLDILYYIGHGSAQVLDWPLGKSPAPPVNANAIVSQLGGRSAAPLLSVLLTCAGGTYATHAVRKGERFSDTLVRNGAPAVVAMFGRVDIRATAVLANAIQSRFDWGKPLDRLIQDVRRHIYEFEMGYGAQGGGIQFEAYNWYRCILTVESPAALDAFVDRASRSPMTRSPVAGVMAERGSPGPESAFLDGPRAIQALSGTTESAAAELRRWRDARAKVAGGISVESMQARLDQLKPLLSGTNLADSLAKVQDSLAKLQDCRLSGDDARSTIEWKQTIKAWRDCRWHVAAEASARGL